LTIFWSRPPQAVIGAGVSGTFLWMIGVLNFLVLLDILKGWRQAKTSAHSHMHVDELLSQRGFIPPTS
jgi:nickel/cobalt transporter (NiCoT) family protein